MRSILLCEGKTDADFLQYYMRKVHQWEDGRPADFKPKGFTFGRILTRDNDELSIIALNGCGDIINGVKEALEHNILERPDKIFKNVIFVTDNDDEATISDRISEVVDITNSMGIVTNSKIENANWTELCYKNNMG